jgi:hypothetical protein
VLRPFKIGACGACFLFKKALALKKTTAMERGVLTSHYYSVNPPNPPRAKPYLW